MSLIDPSKVSVKVGGATISAGGKVSGVPAPAPGMPAPTLDGSTPTVEQQITSMFTNFAQGPQMDPDRFIALIQAQNPNVEWEKACICPNTTDDGTHDPTCELCDHGILYFEKLKVPMLVTSASLQQSFFLQGRYTPGSIMVSAAPSNMIAEGDRITVLESTVRNSTKRRRTNGTLIDHVKYPIKSVLLLRTRDAVFSEGSDFEVQNGAIVWTKNKRRRPEDGAWFSLAYTHSPTYIITDMLHAHRDRRVTAAGKSFTAAGPIQAIAKVDYAPRDEGKDAPTDPNPSPYGGLEASR